MNLEQQVKHLDKHYRDGNALVSDKQFDQLEKQLLAINPDSDYFTNRDALPLPSLEKDPIEDFLDGLAKDEQIVIEPKIDGCAVAIEYRNGKIHHAITRKGKDITDKMIRIRTVPLTIPTKETVQVRGELYAEKEIGNVSPGHKLRGSADNRKQLSDDEIRRLNLIRKYLVSGDFEEALLKAEDGNKKYPENVGFVQLRGEAYLKLGDKESAKQEFQRAIKLNPKIYYLFQLPQFP